MTAKKPITKWSLMALSVLMLTAISAQAVEDTYYAVLGPKGELFEGGGSGYNNGTWYYYPITNWRNQWFYNAPYNPDRRKTIEIRVTVEPYQPGLPSSVEIALNWSTGAWSQLGKQRPPLPSDIRDLEQEQMYITRKTVGSSSGSGTISFSYEITDYNPEWVSIDIRGQNVRIKNGWIKHECLPKVVPTQACCLPDGTCMDIDPTTCRLMGGTPQGPGTNCNTVVCPKPTQACCLPDGTCIDTDPTTCRLMGGIPQGSGTNCNTVVCPRTPGEIDVFSKVSAQVTLRHPDGSVEQVQLNGSATQHVFFDGPNPGSASDDDGDGLDEVETEMVELTLRGTSSLDGMTLKLHPTRRSKGQIEETANNTPGMLDFPPFTPVGLADSFFDIFVEIDVGGMSLFTNDPKRLSGIITHKPPEPCNILQNQQNTPLYNSAGGPTGFYLGPMLLGLPGFCEACCLPDGTCIDTTAERCKALGGDPQGPGTNCATNICPLPTFDDCGVLVKGVECILFQADSGGLYVLDNLGGFVVGDRVRVRGILDTKCITFCMQGDGCIKHNTISVCPEGCGWKVGDPHKMHFPQLPDPQGWDIDVTWANILADDWKCANSGPVSDIHFWYSWWKDKIGIIDKIHVSIYSNISAEDKPGSFSKPGKVLWEREFGADQFNLCYYGSGNQGFMIGSQGIPNDHKQIFQCDIVKIPDPFVQKQGTIYWLVISVWIRDPVGTHIGWKTSQNHFEDDAVHGSPDTGWMELRDPLTRESLDLAFVITGGGQPSEPKSDLGDAPDSSNTVGAQMTAYPKDGPPGVVAKYPTVYQVGSPPYGPIHWQPLAVAYLGQAVTLENEADVGPDQDGINNIVPNNDTPDLDKADDGVQVPLVLPHCELTSFDYWVTVAPLAMIEPPTLYVNVWFDWNRDGDWNDTMECQGGGAAVLVPEWAVQNQELNFVTSGQYNITTPPFMCWNPVTGVAPDPIWMRITLSERKWQPTTSVPGVGGSGPANGYEFGETEDYYFVPEVETPPEPKPPAEHLKWSQPPIEWSPMMRTPTYCGWDEPSLRRKPTATAATQWKVVADDFRCIGDMPITSIHWWGSYKNWNEIVPPQPKPTAWRVGFWSNVPAGQGTTFSRPGKLLWQVEASADRVSEDWVGIDRYPQKPTETCFQYFVQLKPEEYFWQQRYFDSAEPALDQRIFWISIVAIYPPSTGNILEWGWKTRPWHWMDDAVTFELFTSELKLGTELNPQLVQPIISTVPCGNIESYDMAFELDTDPNYIKWEQAYTGIRDWPHYEDEKSMAVELSETGAKWVQQPDLTSNGVDVDATAWIIPPIVEPQILADDFQCKTTGAITGIDIWGSWYKDVWSETDPTVMTFVLTIRADIPANTSPTGHSMPGQVLWQKAFGAGQFTMTRQEAPPESYYNPCVGTFSPQNHKMVYKYSFNIDPNEAFVQKGTTDKPTVYWLCVQAQLMFMAGTEATWFGWKTSVDHWNDDAVWAKAEEPYSGTWNELRYPSGHPYKGRSIDLAFVISTSDAQPGGTEFQRVVADDWRCERRTPITSVVWWGSYIGYNYEACQCQTSAIPPTKPDYFLLSIWTDVPNPNPDDPNNYSHPGLKIWEYKATDYDEVLVGYDKHPEYGPTVPPILIGREPVFRYSVILPKENWFCQDNVNDVYWLSVVAVYKNSQDVRYPWGWTNHKCTSWGPTGPMVLHWKLDETAGIIANDDSGKGNHGKLFGDAKWAVCCGRTCGALDLDGNGDYAKVDTPTGLNFAPGSFTTSAWVKSRTVVDGWKTIIEYDRDGWELNRFGMWLNEEGRFHFRVGWDGWYSNQKLNANQWYLLTGVYDSTTKKMSLYVNGQFDSSADVNKGFTKANVAKLTVGVRGSEDGEYFNGLIDDVRIYNYALSLDDVKVLYTARNDDAVAGQLVLQDPARAGPKWVWEPLHDQTGMSEDMSFILFTEPGCFPCCNLKYLEWLSVGKPDCWCYPRQCHGDADGKYQGSATKSGVYYVGTNDLNVLMTAWQVKEPPWGPGIATVQWNGIGGICADFARDQQGAAKSGVYRVGTNDLNILLANWLIKEPPQGHGVPPDCLDCPRPEPIR